MVVLNKKNSEKINPATEEKQDAIIAALGGIPTNDNANIDDLITELELLKGALTDHSQLTQVVKSDGTPVDFAAQFAALAAKFTDTTQKTKIISDAGVVADLTTQLAAILAKFTDHLQLTQVVKSDGTPVDFAAQFAALVAKFTDGAQLTQVVNPAGRPQGKPDYFDTTTSSTVVYEGYKSGATVYLCKIDLTAGTRTWATDSWANRVTATYA
ncbi:MAG: hypothetical protein ACOYMF_05595 [Bacteroidales bacterium]